MFLLQFANCQLHVELSGRPGSNRPPEAWKATALPNELLPLINMQIGKCAKMQTKKELQTRFAHLPIGIFANFALWAE